MQTILMLKYGTKYSKKDVDRIIEATGSKYNYACITDDTTLDPRVKIIPLPEDVDATFIKVWMYGLEDLGDVLYFDLDIRIQKDIDNLWNYLDERPTICYTYWKDISWVDNHARSYSEQYLSNYNSSAVLWRSGSPKAKAIWEHFEKDADYYMIKYWGDDRFLWHEKFDFKWFPKGEFYSFLYGADYYDPEKRVVDKYRPEYTVCLLNGLDYFPGYDKKYDELSNNKMG